MNSCLAPWFGAKRDLADTIVSEFGPHKAYWEPFCGSMAVLFAKPTCRMETVNDLHEDLINLACVVRCETLGRKLYEEARLIPCSDADMKWASNLMRQPFQEGDSKVQRALAYLVSSWQGRNGECGVAATARMRSLCVRWGNTGGSPSTRWYGTVRSIAAWRRRLSKVTVLNRDGFEMISKIADEPDVVIYCDPPYIVKKNKYLHDFNDADHSRLAELLKRFRRARCIVSYYDHPRLAELYPGWTVRRIEVAKKLSQWERGKAATKAVECLLINGPSLVGASVQRVLI